MKYTIVVAALFGILSTTQAKDFGHIGRLTFLNTIIEQGDMEAEASSSSSSSEEDVQLNGSPYGEIPASMDGAETGGGYTRVVPHRFTEERDDQLMNSLITKYAREITDNGKLTGHMFCNKDDAYAVSKEVVGTHLGYKGEDIERYLSGGSGGDPIFENVFNHFDVNKDGLIEVERMPQFLRMVLGNSLEINLQ